MTRSKFNTFILLLQDIDINGYIGFFQFYIGRLLNVDDGSMKIAMGFHP